MNTQAAQQEQVTKLPSTNNAAYRARMRSYLADAVEIDDKPNATEQERLNHLAQRFRAEYGWAIERQGKQRAAVNWLQGLAINVECWNHAIPKQVLKLHGMEGRTVSDKFAERLVDGWWNHLAANVVRLLDNYERTGNA